LGAKIALNDIALQEENLKIAVEEIKKAGAPEVKYYCADVSKFNEVEVMMQNIQKEFGRLDVLVNNAGITKDRTLAKMTSEEWQKVIDVNLTSVFNCSRLALPLLIPSQGNIVSLSSFPLCGVILAKQTILLLRQELLVLPKLLQKKWVNLACE